MKLAIATRMHQGHNTNKINSRTTREQASKHACTQASPAQVRKDMTLEPTTHSIYPMY